ncbi:esterase/lipase family protein [Oceanimonas smirnovii]|uniref:esterase/lipase family protein n=1 Tax=Oceanimonas smirnovii TaxID=264574 RepID=UPI00376F73AF
MANIIILIHGLGGKKDGTWGKFPELLEEDEEIPYQVYSVGYTTPMPELKSPKTYLRILGRAPSLLNIANGILTDIETHCDLEKDNIILAGHSLGGIVLKKVLLMLKNRGQVHNIKKVCFFDVPHEGSGYANVGKYIIFRNRHLKSLVSNSVELEDLNEQWVGSRLNNELTIQSIIAENDDIVSATSSKSIFREHSIKTISNVNHKSIVKPESAESTVYKVFKIFILKKNTVSKYNCSASRDIHDWKSIEERNHAFNYASDSQRQKDLQTLSSALKQEQVIIRLVGASGMGKTRILLEAIKENDALTDEHILVYNAPEYETRIKESVRAMVEESAHGLVIVENCLVDLHNALARELHKKKCPLKIVTIGYSDEQVDDSNFIQLKPMSDEAIIQLLSPILINLSENEIKRIAQFAEGYPLMATLIAEQYQKEGKLLGSIEQHSIVKKLISSDGNIQDDEKDILTACSLFDVFGTTEGSAGEEAKYIAESVAESNLKAFDKVLRAFTAKQIINRAGRYARVVPKPLALTLASDWWEEASHERQSKLVETLPESLFQSFCTQAAYLDNQPNVQKFSDKLFGNNSPFMKAEVLLTERGSQLFRSFVEINPQSTCNSLNYVLNQFSHDKLLSIGGNTRRNLIWGLEKLCFHSQVFEKAAWCMLLLASAENETWGNNATGMFAQLYKLHLSGTQAEPKIRLNVLRKAAADRNRELNLIIVKALEQALRIDGGTRMVGAEYQGTKAPLKEWAPQIWQEIYDYWQQAIDLLLALLDKDSDCDEQVRKVIGRSIRLFVRYQRFDMMDGAIKTIVSKYGPYWPEALSSIKNTFEYDSDNLTEKAVGTLREWSNLLNPDDAELVDKLKIIVINPPTEHRMNDDGHYIDIAEENAKALATSISKTPVVLEPHLLTLLQGEQRQSSAFGYQLALEIKDPQELLDLIFKTMAAMVDPNINLLLGVFRGIKERSVELWNHNIERLTLDRDLVQYYPHCLRTGRIDSAHLTTLLDLICKEQLPLRSADLLSYGSVTRYISPSEIVDFCLALAKMSEQAKWTALNVLYMYSFGNKNAVNELREPFKKLVTEVSLHTMQQDSTMDVYHWKDITEKLLEGYDEELALSLTKQLITGCSYGYEHGNIWSNIKPILNLLMLKYGSIVWPKFADAIVNAEGLELYWLQQLLDRDSGLVDNAPSVLSVLPIKNIIDWCKEHNPDGPIFISRCLNIFDMDEDSRKPSELFIAIIENFGSNEYVTNELHANFGSRGWVGSLVPYLEADKEALTPLLKHEKPCISNWVNEFIKSINGMIETESQKDEEKNFRPY